MIDNIKNELMQAITSDCQSYYELNLTKNKLIIPVMENCNGFFIPVNSDFDLPLDATLEQVGETLSNSIIGNKEDLLINFNPYFYINLYNSGIYHHEYQITYINRYGNETSALCMIYLYKEDKDLILLCVCKSLDFMLKLGEEALKYNEAIRVLNKEFEGILYVNCDTLSTVSLKASKYLRSNAVYKSQYNFKEGSYIFAERFVHPDDRKALLRALELNKILKNLNSSKVYYINFRILKGEKTHHYQFKIVRNPNLSVNSFYMGFSNIDAEIQNELTVKELFRKQRAETNQLDAVLKTLAVDYEVLGYVNLDTDSYYEYQSNQIWKDFSNYLKGKTFTEKLESAIKLFVYWDDRAQVKEFFDREILIKRLKTEGYAYLRLRGVINGSIIYYEVKVSIDKSATAVNQFIIGIKNIDVEVRHNLEHKKQLEAMNFKESIYKNAINNDATGYYECNLTQDLIIGDIYDYNLEDPVVKIKELDYPYCYSEYIDFWIKNMNVTGTDDYETITNKEYLISSFINGEFVKETTYWLDTLNGLRKCHRQTYYLARDKNTGDIIALCVVKDITPQALREEELKRNQEIIHILASDYVSVYYVDALQQKVTQYSDDETDADSKLQSGFDYFKNYTNYVYETVYADDISMMLRAGQIENIKAQLKNKISFTTNFRRNVKGVLHYWEMKIVRVDEDVNFFAIGLADRDYEIRREKERQAELEAAIQRSEEGSQAKTSFLFNMSHDIRTPMNAILGFAKMAHDHINDPILVNDYLSKLELSGNHLLKLNNDVLDMSRIESGNVTIEEEAISLNDFFDTIIDMTKESANNKKIDVKLDLSKLKHPRVFADTLRLRQIALNVISNAIKYTNENGAVSIVVDEIKFENGYSQIKIIISDNGIGMSEDFLGHIFEPFSREYNSTTSGVEGTGLGMAITKQLVEMMGGDIFVYSKLNVGTDVYISLTLKIDKTREKIVFEDKTPCNVEGMKILLVDDNKLNREIARYMLEEEGTIVFEACDGDEAVEMLAEAKKGDYDCVLMDIQMPKMDGYTATKTIRSLDNEVADIPIIAMTANAFDEDKRKALEVGMNGHIAKPVDLDRLIEAIFNVKRK